MTNKINYHKIMLEKIKSIGKIKPKLLLHSCCAPCSTTCITALKDAFDLTVFFYNPNMDSPFEYEKRKNEEIKLCKILGVSFVDLGYNENDFYDKIKGYENCPERGERCFICYRLRLEKTADYCQKNGFSYFATTLTLSPLKNSDKINEIGQELEKEYNVNYLPSDFKKDGGYLKSIEYSKEYGLYRQNYCGCKFSKRQTL